MSTVEPKQPDRSLSELIGDMSQGLSTLIQKELELAKEEIQVEVAKASKAGQAFGVAAGAGFYAGIALVITLGLILDTFLWAWLAFLIVTLLLGAIAAVFAQRGQAKVKEIDPIPQATIETLQEDAQWLTEQKN